jgi:hypothetical protein
MESTHLHGTMNYFELLCFELPTFTNSIILEPWNLLELCFESTEFYEFYSESTEYITTSLPRLTPTPRADRSHPFQILHSLNQQISPTLNSWKLGL